MILLSFEYLFCFLGATYMLGGECSIQLSYGTEY